ncbi:MAG: hypothetical protein NT012_03540 [Candidatus Nealsonbacteria bacterium]|nr:hypothetical protein [Candidatus Nealsonbacteria bacterium]
MERDSFRIDLQFHPFKNSDYGLLDILRAMEEKDLDALGCLEYNWQRNVSLAVIRKMNKEVKKNYLVNDVNGNLFFTNKETGRVLCLILGQEVAPPNQEWHFLSIGALEIRSWRRLEDIIEEILDKNGLVVFDHPFADPQRFFAGITKQKEEKLFLLCEKYKGKIALEWNGYCLPRLRKILPFYSDVNKKTEELAKRLGIPVVPTTDLHAIDKDMLSVMGTCFIEIPFDGMYCEKILSVLKESIFSFNFEPHRDYVSFSHFFRAFAVPYIKSKMAAG